MRYPAHPGVFPADFVWGVATAAYQIEGAADRGRHGRRRSGTRSAAAGGVVDGHSGDVACDHYHRYSEDRRPDAAGWASTPTASRSPGRGCSPPARGAAQAARPRLLRPPRRRPARARHPAVARRSTTGTCRRRSRTPAAGRSATPPTASPSTPRSSHEAPRRPGDARGSRSTSRGASRSSATPPACTRRVGRTPSPRCAPPTTCCSPTASRSTRCAPRRATERRHHDSTSTT